MAGDEESDDVGVVGEKRDEDMMVEMVDVNIEGAEEKELTFDASARASRKKSFLAELHLSSARGNNRISVSDVKGFEEEGFELRKHLEMMRDMSRQRNIEKDHVGITFADVSATVRVSEDEEIETVGKAIGQKLPWRRSPKVDREILTKITGYARPGKMLAVIGPPGSGCSSLLQVLAGRTRNLSTVTGELLYNGRPDVAEWVPQMTLVGEDDNHFPHLTVRQTLEFAARCKTPAEFRVQDVGKVVDLIMHLLGIHRVRDTPVGNELVRGCSGGERKRVTIGEMLAGRAPVIFLDGYTKGLDSAAALDIVRTLKMASEVLGLTLVATQYQMSQAIYELFDDVLVLNEGNQLFFGPCAEALGYFKRLGFAPPARRTVPDFLSTLGLMAEERALATSAAASPGTTIEDSEGFARAWESSAECAAARRHIESQSNGIAWQGPPAAQSPEFAAAMRRDFALPVREQIKLLVRRERTITLANKGYLKQRFGKIFMLGTLLGLMFFQQDESTGGAYNRTGLLFFCVTLLGMSSFGFLPAIVNDRTVVDKQKDANFFHPAAFFVAKSLFDIPFTIVESVGFSAIVYWLSGLSSEGMRFLFFVVMAWAFNVVMSNYIRMFAVLFPDVNSAQGACAGSIVLFVLFCGYMIARENIQPYFIWLHYVSPFKYAMESLFINEFNSVNFKCTAEEMVPPAALIVQQSNFTDPAVIASLQVCPFLGGGNGAAYLQARYGMGTEEGLRWLYLLIMAALYVLVMALSCLAITKLSFARSGVVLRFKKDQESLVACRLRRLLNRKLNRVHVGEVEQAQEERDDAYFVWKALSYDVDLPKDNWRATRQRKRLLDNVSGFCRPGDLTALMGSSGAGKTTLLDVLSRRKTGGSVSGEVTVNGAAQDLTFKRVAGYVEQMDMHMPNATVREALAFSAALRLPPDLSDAAKACAVDETLRTLGLVDLQHAMIGSHLTAAGISLEARKRVTIGVELVANPSILFMDEPTSGLDTQAALVVLKAARRIADSGRAVVCTIHQPSTELFEMFDNLLVMQRGGKTVYFGPLGQRSAMLVKYFEQNGSAPFPEHENPADFMLTVIGAGVGVGGGGGGGGGNDDGDVTHQRDWHEIWMASPEREALDGLVNSPAFVPRSAKPFRFASDVGTGLWTQGRLCLLRSSRSFYRDPNYNVFRMVFAITIALLLGLTFFQLASNNTALFYRVAVVFFTVVMGSVTILNVMPPLVNERAAFFREIDSGAYVHRAYFFASGVIELPYAAVAALLFTVIFYWLVGLNPDSGRFAMFYLLFTAFTFFAVYFGQAVAALSGSLLQAQNLAPSISSLLTLFCGFIIRKNDIPDPLLFLYYVNPYTYYLSAVVSNELSGEDFVCDPGESYALPVWPTTPPRCPATPTGQFSTLMDSNGNVTGCDFCPVVDGDTFLSQFSMSYDNIWRDFGVIVGFAALCRLVTYAGLRYLRHGTR